MGDDLAGSTEIDFAQLLAEPFGMIARPELYRLEGRSVVLRTEGYGEALVLKVGSIFLKHPGSVPGRDELSRSYPSLLQCVGSLLEVPFEVSEFSLGIVGQERIGGDATGSLDNLADCLHRKECLGVLRYEGCASGFQQHNPYTWQVLGTDFETVEKRSGTSTFVDETVDQWLDRLSDTERQHFVAAVFDSLEGSGVSTLMGSMLKIHPKIVVEDGAMRPDAKDRGSMQRVLSRYVEDLVPAMQKARRERVFVTHSCYDNDLAQTVVDELKGMNLFDEILETHAGCVVSSHCGPNTLGVLFIAQES